MGTIAVWAPVAVAVTGLALLAYVLVQQDLRMSANNPQVALAEDAARRLDNGASTKAVLPTDRVDLAGSLQSGVLVYDAGGSLVAASATIDGNRPVLPPGVLDSARSQGEDRVTWEPRSGVRLATVVVPYARGFVAAARNLREVEREIDNLGLITAAAWLGTMLATLAASTIAGVVLSRR